MDSKTPIIYEAFLDVRFGDLDPYGHVNASRYLDYVVSSRWTFLERTQSISSAELVRRGLAFFMTKATTEFRKPIAGAAQVRVRSHVGTLEGARLVTPFEIASADGATVHATGHLDFAIMNLETRKPMALPDWAMPLFFQ